MGQRTSNRNTGDLSNSPVLRHLIHCFFRRNFHLMKPTASLHINWRDHLLQACWRYLFIPANYTKANIHKRAYSYKEVHTQKLFNSLCFDTFCNHQCFRRKEADSESSLWCGIIYYHNVRVPMIEHHHHNSLSPPPYPPLTIANHSKYSPSHSCTPHLLHPTLPSVDPPSRFYSILLTSS